MYTNWANLSKGVRRFLIIAGCLAVLGIIILQIQVSSQGDSSNTYPKGFRGGTCTIESENLLVGYSGYFIPSDYKIPTDVMSAMSVPILCGKMSSTGTLDVTIDLLYPKSARKWPLTVTLAKIEKDNSTKMLMRVPEKTYGSGIITQVFNFKETGKYELYLSGKNIDQTEFVLKIPIMVGAHWHKDLLRLWPVLLLVLMSIALYKNLKKDK